MLYDTEHVQALLGLLQLLGDDIIVQQ